MKFIFAILAFAAIAFIVQADLTEEQVEKLKTHHKECTEETGIDSALIANARKGQFSDDIKLKDHLFCVAKKIGFMNEAGDIQKDVLLAKLSPAINDDAVARKLIEECAMKKKTPGETAFETVKCYYLKTPTHITIL